MRTQGLGSSSGRPRWGQYAHELNKRISDTSMGVHTEGCMKGLMQMHWALCASYTRRSAFDFCHVLACAVHEG